MKRHDIGPSLVRRTLFDGQSMRIGHVSVRPTSSQCGEVEVSESNVLALTLAGVFAWNDGPRRQVIATPNHALFISAGKPYRLSFPGCIGDRCLVLQFSSDALANSMPEAFARDGFDATAFADHALLEPRTILARTLLWTDLERGEIDVLEVEERAICLLAASLHAARRSRRGRSPGHNAAARSRRAAAVVVEAIAVDPARRWTLGELAALACISPGHLAHVFRAEQGVSLYQHVLRARLSHALDAVLDSGADITTIALATSFASHSHFTARFRAMFGLTPQELRRRAATHSINELRRILTAREVATA